MGIHQAGVNPSDQATPAGRRKRVSDAEWAAKQSLMYGCMAVVKAVTKKQAKKRALDLAPRTKERVAAAREQLLERHARAAAANPKFTITFWSWIELMATVDPAARLVHRASMEVVWGDIRRQKADILKAEVAARIKNGFDWDGGDVAGNGDYARPAIHYDGLVSSEHAMLQLFVEKLRRVKSLRVGGDKTESIRTQSKLLALDEPYVESNKKVVGVLRVELDSTIPVWAIEDACNDVGCPLPNLVVGYDDEYGENHNPHCLWLLHDSIPVDGVRNIGNAALVRGVSRGLTKALLAIGADVGGLSNAARHKNPLSPLWHRHVLARQPYELSELAAAVDGRVTLETLQADADRIQGLEKAPIAADHALAGVAAGSNRLFRALSMWARENIVAAKAVGNEKTFTQAVADRAEELAMEMTGDAEASAPAALKAAASVARWTWHEYRIPGTARTALAVEEVKARQVASAVQTAAVKRSRTSDLVVSTALRLAAGGSLPTQGKVADAIKAAEGKTHIRTVRHYWPDVLAAYGKQASTVCEKEGVSSPSVKESHISLLGSEFEDQAAPSLLTATCPQPPPSEDVQPSAIPVAEVPGLRPALIPAFITSWKKAPRPEAPRPPSPLA